MGIAADGAKNVEPAGVLIVDQGCGNCRGLPCAMSSSMRACDRERQDQERPPRM
jgi:hypothetical protein